MVGETEGSTEEGKEDRVTEKMMSSEMKEKRRGKRSRDGNKGFGRYLKIEKSEEEEEEKSKKNNKDARTLAGTRLIGE